MIMEVFFAEGNGPFLSVYYTFLASSPLINILRRIFIIEKSTYMVNKSIFYVSDKLFQSRSDGPAPFSMKEQS
jgi:hypothetical protein